MNIIYCEGRERASSSLTVKKIFQLLVILRQNNFRRHLLDESEFCIFVDQRQTDRSIYLIGIRSTYVFKSLFDVRSSLMLYEKETVE